MSKRQNTVLVMVCLLFLSLIVQLSPAAADSLREILRLGRGTANSLDWRPDGEVLAVGGSTGLWFFDASFQQINHIPTKMPRFIQWSPDGTKLAVTVDDENTEIWAVDEGLTEVQPLLVLGKANRFFRWSPDSSRIAYAVGTLKDGQAKGNLVIKDATTGKTELTIPDLYFLTTPDWNPEGNLIAMTRTEKEIGVWDITTGQLTYTYRLPGDYDTIGGLTFSHDGKNLYITSAQASQVIVWNLPENDFTQTDVGHDSTFLYDPTLLHPQQEMLAMLGRGYGGASDEIYVFGVALKDLPRHGFNWDWIRTFSWMPHSNNLTVLTGNGMIHNWDVVQNQTVEYQYFNSTTEIAWSPDSRFLAQSSGTYGFDTAYPVLIWDTDRAQPSSNFEPMRAIYPLLSLRWMAWKNNQHLMTFSDNAAFPTTMCLIFEMEDWIVEVDQRAELFYEGGACGIEDLPQSAFDFIAVWKKDFSEVAYKDGDNRVLIAPDSPYFESRLSFQAHAKLDSIAWNVDETRILTISTDETTGLRFAEVWDAESGKRLSAVDTTADHVISWSPDGATLALTKTGQESVLQLWDAETDKLRDTFPFSKLIQIVGWSPDNTKLVVYTDSDMPADAMIVDAQTGNTIETFSGSAGIEWSPDSRFGAINTPANESIVFWDSITGTRLEASTEPITSLIWSPDGSKLALWMRDGTIRIWDVFDLG